MTAAFSSISIGLLVIVAVGAFIVIYYFTIVDKAKAMLEPNNNYIIQSQHCDIYSNGSRSCVPVTCNNEGDDLICRRGG